jgi:hypothetical protein
MSINEIPTHQSNLTELEQREALAAAYGLPGAPMSPNNTHTEFTYEERVKMRRHLDELDAKEAGGQKEFDLNKPPVPRYVYREYPFLMYHHATRQTRPAQNFEQREKMLAEGWSADPVPIETPAIELTIEEQMQAEEIDRQLKMPKDQLEAERSAEHMAKMRAEIAELRARAEGDQQREFISAGAETEPRKSQTKRSKA